MTDCDDFQQRSLSVSTCDEADCETSCFAQPTILNAIDLFDYFTKSKLKNIKSVD